MKRREVFRRLLGACLLLALLAGCAPASPAPGEASPAIVPTPEAAPEATPAAEPSPEPTPAGEATVYVPTYEPLPDTMDPITTRFPVETAEGVWFLRMVQTPEGSGYRLMRGGKNAADPVTVAAFPADAYVGRLLPTPTGTVWVDRTDFTTGEAALLELDGESGEIRREIPLPAETGSVLGLFDLPDGRLGIAASLPDMTQALYALDGEVLSPVIAPLNDSGDFLRNVTFLGSAGCGLEEGECLAYDRESLFAFTPGSLEKRELLRWADWGISAFNTQPIGREDGVLRLMDMRYREIVTLTPTPRSQVKPRQEVTMACLYVESAVDDAVRDFNRRSTEYFITLRDYSGGRTFSKDVQDQAITALNLDIASGKMPDLLSVQDGVPFQSYGKKGLLRDLGPWLEAEGIELLPQLRRACTVEGKTLAVCGSFAILTAVGSRDAVGERPGWTVAEAQELAASLPDCEGVFTSGMTRDLYMIYLSSYLEGYLDRAAGTASFDSPGFRDALAFAAALPEQPPRSSDTGDGEVMAGKALVTAATVASIGNWQVRDLVYLGKLACPGFPAADRVSSLLYMTAPMAMSASAACPEGALAFLGSLLDEEAQTAYTELFPSVRGAFENQLAEAMRQPGPEEGYKKVFIMSNGGRFLDPTVYLWEGAGGEPAPRSVLTWLDDNGSVIREERMYAMSEEQKERLLALLDSAARSSSYDQVLASIVKEEAGALFAGQRTVEEVSQRIQARAALYLAEQN